MASPVNLYHREMHDRFGFLATWLPGDSGDVGSLIGGRFRKVASLEELGIEVEEGKIGAPQDCGKWY